MRNNLDPKKEYLKNRSSSYTSSIVKIAYDGNPNIFVGAALNFDKRTKNITLIQYLQRKPYKIAINGHLSNSIANTSKISAEIEINNIIAQNHIQPSAFKANLYYIESLNDLKTKLNISCNYDNYIDLFNSFDFKHKDYKTNALMVIQNTYFQVDFDYKPEIGIDNFFDENVSLDDIKMYIKTYDVPLFVSSFEYGNQILISLQTNKAYQELSNQLNTNGCNVININSLFNNLTHVHEINYHIFINGLSVKLSDLNGDINGFINSLSNNQTNLGIPISYCLCNIGNGAPFHHPRFTEINKISIIYVLPEGRSKNGIDFSFLKNYRSKLFTVELTCEKQSSFTNKVKANSEYLSTFSGLFLGGEDNRDNYDEFDKAVLDRIKEWYNNNHFILFLHDFISQKTAKTFGYFINKMGYINDKSDRYRFSRVVLKNNAPKVLLKFPYQIDSETKIAKTHESAVFNSRFVLIKDLKSNEHYYCANQAERVGSCSAGHYCDLSTNEKKLFINILFHLMNGVKQFDIPFDDHSINEALINSTPLDIHEDNIDDLNDTEKDNLKDLEL